MSKFEFCRPKKQKSTYLSCAIVAKSSIKYSTAISKHQNLNTAIGNSWLSFALIGHVTSFSKSCSLQRWCPEMRTQMHD